jgi:hypothetical protein
MLERSWNVLPEPAWQMASAMPTRRSTVLPALAAEMIAAQHLEFRFGDTAQQHRHRNIEGGPLAIDRFGR